MNRIVACATGLALLFTAARASAEDPFTENRVQASAHVGYGLLVGDDELNPYGFALGARAGYTLDPHIYLGALFDYTFGESEESPFGFDEIDANLWLLQAEGGYDLGLTEMITLRPKVAVGIARISSRACYPVSAAAEECEGVGDTRLAIAGGVEALFDLEYLFVAPEARFNFVDDASGVILAVGAGASF